MASRVWLVLNQPLYTVLVKHFGQVKITNENVRRVEQPRPGQRPLVATAGEHYVMCCPLCKEESFRFTVSYLWLTHLPFSTKRITHLANCYNENCPVWESEFWEPLLDDLEAAKLGLLQVPDAVPGAARIRRRRLVTLPNGLVSLDTLPAGHPALAFLRKKYQIPPAYMSRQYGVMWGATEDPRQPMAYNRVVFPIYQDQRLVAWQGRTIDPEVQPRWFLPAGFVKCYYNGDRVPPHELPVIGEGIPAAIACGPTGLGIFGKTLNTIRAEEYGKKWRAAIIATDPETFVPDNRKGGGGRVYALEMAELLGKHIPDVRLIKWPADILDIAKAHNDGQDVPVPDPADLGPKRMKELLDAVR